MKDYVSRFRNKIKTIRLEKIGSSKKFVDEALQKEFIENLDLKNPSKCILEMRERLWSAYLSKEKETIYPCIREAFLSQNKPEFLKTVETQIKNILKTCDNDSKTAYEIMIQATAIISAEAYQEIYEVSKSFTQARRSRAGQEFQNIIEILMRLYGFDYDNQAKIGKGRFNDILGLKMVDGIFPGIDSFNFSKQNCCILTLKTSLRERWQEVVDEKQRCNIPSIYLLTLDSSLTDGMLNQMHEHNILLVTLKSVKNRFQSISHIHSYEEFFLEILPERQKWWKKFHSS
ncbi:MAG: hypothetical protein EBR01_14060 [Proteobacteria bacterium]|nr:hypothetical protein [Pseudomonadota bacterium]